MSDANVKQEQTTKPLSEMTEPEVIEAYTYYVERIADKLARDLKIRIERDDLVSYGLEGLLQAWRRYDPTSPAAFTSYAYYRIRGNMLDGCRKEGWATRPRSASAKTQAAINDHLESNHEATADRPAARTLSESVDRVANTVGNVLTIVMLRETDMDGVMGHREPSQDKQLERKNENERLANALGQLEEVERVLIKRHHYYDESLTDIGNELGLSTSWCSRIHARALEKLRELLTSDASPALA